MPTLTDLDFFLDGPIDDSGFRTYRFPSGRMVDLLPTAAGWSLARGDGRAFHGLTEADVVERLSVLAAAQPAAA